MQDTFMQDTFMHDTFMHEFEVVKGMCGVPAAAVAGCF
jgi:hypothetical protein